MHFRLIDRGSSDLVPLPAQASYSLACALLAIVAEADPAANGAGTEQDAVVRSACGWLAARLDQPVGIRQAADAQGVSREHLTRIFTRIMGESPGAWLTRQRLSRGEQLLREEKTLSIRAVAAACGLADAGHFAAMFARRYGVAPAAYRRRLTMQAVAV